MRWLVSCLLLALCGAVHALSSSGSRLLVVLEAGEKKDLYSTLWKDLEGMVLGPRCMHTGHC